MQVDNAVNALVEKDIAHLVHPYTNQARHLEKGPSVIERGDGCYVYDNQGTRYLEAMSGLWCASLGFSEKRLVEAAKVQLDTLPYFHLFNHYSHPAAIQLAEKLVSIAPNGLQHVLFANSGSEANDSAVKMVWYYHNAIGKPQKKKIIGRQFGYHGVTVASGSLTGLPPVHANFDLPIDRMLHTSCPSYYHHALEGESEEAFTTRMVNDLEQLIEREGADTIGAFIAEPVIGAGGVLTPPTGYFQKVQAVLKRHDILFIADEVICGFGRTGQMFGCNTYGIEPDMMTVAKGLSAAYQPISALIFSDKINQALVELGSKNSLFAHGVTYAAHPVCAAVALETLRIYQDDDIVGKVQAIAPYFQQRLAEIQDHPLVSNTRGVGLLGGVEIVRDKASRTPFPAELDICNWIQRRCAEYGVIVRAIRQSIALCPPLIVIADQVDEIFEALGKALDDAAREH